jgi:hypothetical protein
MPKRKHLSPLKPPQPANTMFQRVIHENWAIIVPIFSFTVTAGIFLFVSIRAIMLPKKRREELARIPLD